MNIISNMTAAEAAKYIYNSNLELIDKLFTEIQLINTDYFTGPELLANVAKLGKLSDGIRGHKVRLENTNSAAGAYR